MDVDHSWATGAPKIAPQAPGKGSASCGDKVYERKLEQKDLKEGDGRWREGWPLTRCSTRPVALACLFQEGVEPG